MPDEPPIERVPQESERPEFPDAAQRPRVGVDTWVAEHGERSHRYAGWRGPLLRALDRIPLWARLLLFAGAAALYPLAFHGDEYLQRVGVDTLIYMLLAVGLNIVVGYAGLLDLGYIAFFGVGAYTYAVVSSDKFDYHWPSWVSLPFILVVCAVLGLVLGLPSRRLLGDYLAIVTLFFGQIFVTITNNAIRLDLPFTDKPVDLTNGPNGITELDEISFGGLEITSTLDFFYFSLVVFLLVVLAVHLVNESRTGRAWRALREDPLAAEAMTIPVNRLKLLAFGFGAATAGLTGAIFASLQGSVFPQNFNVQLLIIIYAMVILGGAGSLPGVALGAIVVNGLLEVLTRPDQARVVFYAAILLGIVLLVRPWQWLAYVLGATLAFGLVVRQAGEALWERGVSGNVPGRLGGPLEQWLLVPSNPEQFAKYAYVGLIAAVLALTLLGTRLRWILLPAVLWLGAFVWENVLIGEPATTRFILLGAILVALMAARPQGLFGTTRVEIV